MNYIVTVNPHGGTKKGLDILNKIEPIFKNAGLNLFIIETTFAGHAQEIAKQIDFSNYDGFIGIGGDGTLNEIINGMLSRNDNQILPIGIIPAGSGNSYMHDLELTNPVTAAKAIIKNNTKNVDVIKLIFNNIVKYAINMIGWGLVTDIGIKAENYRWLGTNRYTFFSITEVLKNKTRAAKLIIDKNIIEDNFTFIIACNSIHVGKGMKMAPKAKLDDGLIDLIVVRGRITRLRLLQVLPKLFDGSHINETELEYYQAKNFSIITNEHESLNIDGEVMGKTPISVEVINNGITIYS